MSGTLIPVHGFLGSARDWETLRVPEWTVSPWELPGHGRRHAEFLPASFSETVLALAAYVRRQPGPRLLLGYSMGARVALGAAVELGADLDGLILESGRAGIGTAEARAARRVLDSERAASLREMGSAAFLEEWYRLPLFATLAGDPERLRARIDARKNHPAAAWADALEVLGTGQQPDYRGALPAIRCPVQLIVGELDTAYVAHAREIAEGVQTADLDIVPGAGHDVHSECIDVFCESLQRFFEAHFSG